MENFELTDRLYQISKDEITTFLDFDEPIIPALYKLDMAARTRHVIHAVQMENISEAFNEESKVYETHLEMRLSPMTLSSCVELNAGMNGLQWRFVLPAFDYIAPESRPLIFGQYLPMNMKVQVMDIEDYDIAKTVEFLEKSYDFTPNMLKQILQPLHREQRRGFSR